MNKTNVGTDRICSQNIQNVLSGHKTSTKMRFKPLNSPLFLTSQNSQQMSRFKKLSDKNTQLQDQVPVQKVKMVEPVAKQGRPSAKKAGVTYVKLGAQIPEATRKRMKLALLQVFPDTHRTQDELIDAAINHYIDQHEK